MKTVRFSLQLFLDFFTLWLLHKYTPRDSCGMPTASMATAKLTDRTVGIGEKRKKLMFFSRNYLCHLQTEQQNPNMTLVKSLQINNLSCSDSADSLSWVLLIKLLRRYWHKRDTRESCTTWDKQVRNTAVILCQNVRVLVQHYSVKISGPAHAEVIHTLWFPQMGKTGYFNPLTRLP